MSLFSLNEKVVVITGGYGHLGRAMSQGLLEAGATVAVLGRSEDHYQQAFPEGGEKLHFFSCDVASSDSVREAFAQVHEECGSFDVLINNAFYLKGQEPFAISDEEWAVSMDGCLGSVYRCIREAKSHLARRSRIINISSMYGMVAPDFQAYEGAPEFLNPPHYGAAKAGVIQLTKYFAQLLGPEGISVNSISPGPFPNIEVQKNEGFIEALNQRTALGRIGQADELAGPVVFLASEAASYLTGHNLVVDGGWTTS